MRTVKDFVEKTSKELVAKMVARDEGGWPPICTSLIYQPKRPKFQNENAHTDDKNSPVT